MRDFSRTAEPSGAKDARTTPRLRFVIQRHDATRLHYDLRLELDGVFKSWAGTKGPSLDPSVKRLAVEVEDHPLEYGDFEGTIPEGEYGGGTVQLWERGYWTPEVDPEDGLKRGDLKFSLDGKRLHGSWVLVRMRHDREGRSSRLSNWLLIKHTDSAARAGDEDAVLADPHSIASGRTLEEISMGRGRKPKPFITAKAKAKALPRPARVSAKPMPRFVEPQLCRLVERAPDGPGWAHEVKLDGYRMQLRVEAGEARLLTRTGLDWTGKFPRIAERSSRLRDCIVDGEVVALDRHGAPDFAALQAALSEGETGELVFFAFDLMFLAGTDLRAVALRGRKSRLNDLIAATRLDPSIRYVEHLETAGDAVLKSACRMKLEGVISKRLDEPYRSGRGPHWTKAKCRAGHEVMIGGWTTDGGKLRSLLVGVHRGDKLVYVGRVGTGFGRANADSLLERLKVVQSKKSPFMGKGAPSKVADVRWADPDLMAEIEFAGWTGRAWSVRRPSKDCAPTSQPRKSRPSFPPRLQKRGSPCPRPSAPPRGTPSSSWA